MLSLAAGVLPDFSPEITARAAAAAGYDATGLWVDLKTWSMSTTRAVNAILADHALRALDVEVVWLKRRRPHDAYRRIVDIGRAVGAANVLCVSSDPDDGATAARLAMLCDYAAGDIRIVLEFGLFTAVKTIDQAMAILARVDHPASALLIDPLHLARSGGTPADVARVPRKWLTYAQFCDAGPLDYDLSDRDAIIDEAVDRRLQVGEGLLPLGALAKAFPADLPLSIELRSKALRDAYPDPTERARAVLDATRRFFAREDR